MATSSITVRESGSSQDRALDQAAGNGRSSVDGGRVDFGAIHRASEHVLHGAAHSFKITV